MDISPGTWVVVHGVAERYTLSLNGVVGVVKRPLGIRQWVIEMYPDRKQIHFWQENLRLARTDEVEPAVKLACVAEAQAKAKAAAAKAAAAEAEAEAKAEEAAKARAQAEVAKAEAAEAEKKADVATLRIPSLEAEAAVAKEKAEAWWALMADVEAAAKDEAEAAAMAEAEAAAKAKAEAEAAAKAEADVSAGVAQGSHRARDAVVCSAEPRKQARHQ